MVPPEFTVYFTTMAAVGATLFGLIFVVISIAPESITTTDAPLDRQVKAFTAYIALLNPLIISLFALVPRQQIGTVVLCMGLFGFINTLVMFLNLFQNFSHWSTKLRGSPFVVAGFVLYGYETYFGIRLLQTPTDTLILTVLADLLIGISIFGIIRAWRLVGIRQFHIRDWLASFRVAQIKERAPEPPSAHPAGPIKKDQP